MLDSGEVPTGPEVLHVDCSAIGLRASKAVPIFGDDRIVLQQVRYGSPSFNAALLGFIESRDASDEDKNRLSPPDPHPSSIEDWGPMMRLTWLAQLAWSHEPDVDSWVGSSRLNLMRALARAPRRTAHAGCPHPLPDERRPGHRTPLDSGVNGHERMDP